MWALVMDAISRAGHKNLRHDSVLILSTTCQLYVDVLAHLGNHILVISEPQDPGSMND
jgi:CII-binding regulator of phage lambda lysogenization HflD